MSDSQTKVTGIVQQIDEPQVISDKLTKRQLILTVGDKYPEPIAFEAVNDRCDLLNGLTVGQELTAYYNLRGREWNSRFFVNLSLWKVEVATGATQPTAAPKNDFASANKNPALRAQPAPIASVDDNDLPF